MSYAITVTGMLNGMVRDAFLLRRQAADRRAGALVHRVRGSDERRRAHSSLHRNREGSSFSRVTLAINSQRLCRISLRFILAQEAPLAVEGQEPPVDWPRGRIEVRNLVLRYRADQPPVLDGISFLIRVPFFIPVHLQSSAGLLTVGVGEGEDRRGGAKWRGQVVADPRAVPAAGTRTRDHLHGRHRHPEDRPARPPLPHLHHSTGRVSL